MPLSRRNCSCIRNQSMCSYPGSDLSAQPSTAEFESKKYLLTCKQPGHMSADFMPKLSCDLHRVHADDRQIIGNHLHVEPTAPLELVPLRLRYEIPPNFQVFQRPSVRPSLEDIVRHHIIVAKRRNDRNGKIVCRICVVDVVVLPENLCELGNQQLILFHDLLLAPWQLLIVVVPR
jgi:hypothetical protein